MALIFTHFKVYLIKLKYSSHYHQKEMKIEEDQSFFL